MILFDARIFFREKTSNELKKLYITGRFAYGFLNGASMMACGLAPFVYTGLLSFLSKTMVWIVLSLTFVAMVIAELVYQGWIRFGLFRFMTNTL
jgi:hypothetical protein